MAATRILVTGSRTWTDQETVVNAFKALAARGIEREDLLVIHGDARGLDRMVKTLCRGWNVTQRAYPADWDTYGKAAGPIRNQQMLDEGHPHVVWAFFDMLPVESRGTQNMVTKATQAGVPVKVFYSQRMRDAGDAPSYSPQGLKDPKPVQPSIQRKINEES